jgi:hypothetical protein
MLASVLCALMLVTGIAAPAAPAGPVAPAAASTAERLPLPRDLQELVDLARALHEALDRTPPAPGPVVDGPACPPATWELVELAGAIGPQVRSETTLTVPRGTTLDVNTLSGTIGAQAWPRSDVRIVAHHGRRDRVLPRLQNGTLFVTVVNRHGEPAFGDMTVYVPDWMAVRLSSVESRIDIDGVQAAVDAGSVQGDVVARQTRGSLQVHSVEGLVRVLDARGRVSASSVNNLVRLERVVGGIDAESVNGDIQLSDVESGQVDASSVNGSVFFLSPFQPRGRYRLASHNGNLRVGVPRGADVDVSVRNFRGAFQNDVTPPARGRGEAGRFVFTLGGGGSSLELQSFQGLIQLLRSNELPLPEPPRPPVAPREESR